MHITIGSGLDLLHRCRLLLAPLFGALLVACAHSAPVAPLPERRPLGAELAAYEAPLTLLEEGQAVLGVAKSTAPEPSGPLTLRKALVLALQHNPKLAAFSWEVRVREAETLQAGLFPNPELNVEVENFAGEGEFGSFDGAETTLRLGQLIELGGKRVKRRRVAELEQELAGWDYEIQRLEVLTEVVEAFLDVLAAQERLRLAGELVRIAEESLESVARQVRAGATSPVERTRAEVAVSAAWIERQGAEAELAVARTRLAATWGSRKATFDRVEGDLHAIEEPPSWDVLTGRVTRNPDLARWVEEVRLREAVLDLEEAHRIPDVTVGPGVRRLYETNDTTFVFAMTVPLPIFDRNQGAALAARHDLAKSLHERLAVEVRIAADLDAAYQALLAGFQEVRALQEKVLPQAQNAYEGVRRGYLRGLFRYVDVLDAQRTLFELRRQALEALRTYHSAAAQVERLTGTPLHAKPGVHGAP